MDNPDIHISPRKNFRDVNEKRAYFENSLYGMAKNKIGEFKLCEKAVAQIENKRTKLKNIKLKKDPTPLEWQGNQKVPNRAPRSQDVNVRRGHFRTTTKDKFSSSSNGRAYAKVRNDSLPTNFFKDSIVTKGNNGIMNPREKLNSTLDEIPTKDKIASLNTKENFKDLMQKTNYPTIFKGGQPPKSKSKEVGKTGAAFFSPTYEKKLTNNIRSDYHNPACNGLKMLVKGQGHTFCVPGQTHVGNECSIAGTKADMFDNTGVVDTTSRSINERIRQRKSLESCEGLENVDYVINSEKFDKNETSMDSNYYLRSPKELFNHVNPKNPIYCYDESLVKMYDDKFQKYFGYKTDPFKKKSIFQGRNRKKAKGPRDSDPADPSEDKNRTFRYTQEHHWVKKIEGTNNYLPIVYHENVLTEYNKRNIFDFFNIPEPGQRIRNAAEGKDMTVPTQWDRQGLNSDLSERSPDPTTKFIHNTIPEISSTIPSDQGLESRRTMFGSGKNDEGLPVSQFRKK